MSSTDSLSTLDSPDVVSSTSIPIPMRTLPRRFPAFESDHQSVQLDVADDFDGPFNGDNSLYPSRLRRESSALRQGSPPQLWSRATCGLYAQYATVGFMFGSLPGTIYPFLQNYLNVDNQVVMAANALLTVPWCFKVFFGICSDCFPIFKSRRRAHMIIGWSICLAMLLIMAALPIGEPFIQDPALRRINPDEYTDAQMHTLNRSAPNTGLQYIALMMLATSGYLMAYVVADGAVVELAQREMESTRGRLQTVVDIWRTGCMVLSNLIMAFLFNGFDYGGDYEFSLSFPMLMLLLAVFCAPVIPTTWLLVREEKHCSPGFLKYMRNLWETLEMRAVHKFIFYAFCSGICENFTYSAFEPVQLYWVKVTPQNEKLSRIGGNTAMVVALFLMGRYGLHWNWRYMQLISVIMIVGLDALSTMLTTWNICRSKWLWMGVPIIQQFPLAVGSMIVKYVVVELADEGNEAAFCGLLTTASNLAEPLSKTLSKEVNGQFEISNERIQSDSEEARRAVCSTILIMYAVKLSSLVVLGLLPPQRSACRTLKKTGDKSSFCGIVTIVGIVSAFLYSVGSNISELLPSTDAVN